MSEFRVILVRIFPFSDWTRRDISIQSECGKIRTRITPNTDIFCAVTVANALLYQRYDKILESYCISVYLNKRINIPDQNWFLILLSQADNFSYIKCFGSFTDKKQRGNAKVAWEVTEICRCCSLVKSKFVLMYEFTYDPNWKIRPYPLILSLYSTFKQLA